MMVAIPHVDDFNASWSNRNDGEVLVTWGSLRMTLSAAMAKLIHEKFGRALSVPERAAAMASGPSSTIDLMTDWLGRCCDTSDANALGAFSWLYDSFVDYCRALEMGSVVSEPEFARHLSLMRFCHGRAKPDGRKVVIGLRLKEVEREPERVADAGPSILEPFADRKAWLGAAHPFRAKRLHAVRRAIEAAETDMADVVNVGSILFTMDEARTIESGLSVDTDGLY